jgi:hypothetical protein
MLAKSVMVDAVFAVCGAAPDVCGMGVGGVLTGFVVAMLVVLDVPIGARLADVGCRNIAGLGFGVLGM